ncbi:MAG: acyl-homoserine-lactone synthase [Methyloligellaceae bacterium]
MGRIVLHAAGCRAMTAETLRAMHRLPYGTLASPDALRQMHRLRCDVFKKRLHWDIECPSDLDCDEYDAMDPVYALYLNDFEQVEGCWRILPTTGPYMLKDIFPDLVETEAVPHNVAVWEISRFAVSSLSPSYSSLASLHAVTARLLVTLIEFGMANRIKRFVAASDIRFERILRRCGLSVHRMGKVQRIGATPAVAGWIHVSQEHLDQVLDRCPVAIDEKQAA